MVSQELVSAIQDMIANVDYLLSEMKRIPEADQAPIKNELLTLSKIADELNEIKNKITSDALDTNDLTKINAIQDTLVKTQKKINLWAETK